MKYGWLMIPCWWWIESQNHMFTPTTLKTQIRAESNEELATQTDRESHSFLWHHLSLRTPELWPEAAMPWHKASPSHLRRCWGQRLFVFHEQSRQQVKALRQTVTHSLLYLWWGEKTLKFSCCCWVFFLLNLPCLLAFFHLQLAWQIVRTEMT